MNENECKRISDATIEQQTLTGERAAFMAKDAVFVNATFADGESPLKHSENITLTGTNFSWKYPLWYAKNITMKNGTIFEMGRAGIWYTDNISLENVVVEAPKEFRRCHGVALKNVQFSNAAETFWNCDGVTMKDVYAKGDYFAMGSSNMNIENFTLVGNYPFDGVKNVEIRNSKLISKDSFWNSENITIYDSYISGEYFGWNSKNITLVNCTVESLQGFCYIENLVLKNCTLLNTNLAFEYSTVDVDVTNKIDSVKNPKGGTIRAKEIGEIIMEPEKVDVTKTTIITEDGRSA
ncbi:MAG: DUF3737 family protein [Treponema sp.]|nr:DUF3737 family protein [Treponema sp.]